MGAEAPDSCRPAAIDGLASRCQLVSGALGLDHEGQDSYTPKAPLEQQGGQVPSFNAGTPQKINQDDLSCDVSKLLERLNLFLHGQ